jgi:hypothetical protein
MCIEAEDVLRFEALVLAFNKTGVHDFEEEEYGFSGLFPISGMAFYVFQKEKCTVIPQLLAEGADKKFAWPVGTRIKFRYVNENFDECTSQLKAFISNLANVSNANFLLSFQYDTIYAVRDKGGLHKIADF